MSVEEFRGDTKRSSTVKKTPIMLSQTPKEIKKVHSVEEALVLADFEALVRTTLFRLVIGDESDPIEYRVKVLRSFGQAIKKMDQMVFEDERFVNMLSLALVRKEYR